MIKLKNHFVKKKATTTGKISSKKKEKNKEEKRKAKGKISALLKIGLSNIKFFIENIVL